VAARPEMMADVGGCASIWAEERHLCPLDATTSAGTVDAEGVLGFSWTSRQSRDDLRLDAQLRAGPQRVVGVEGGCASSSFWWFGC
jgi:hypothetical protein